MIKADLHIHTNLDPEDGLKGKNIIDYNPEKLIDKAAKLGFTHLSFTHHNQIIFPREIRRYARAKGIILIKGVEETIEGKHVVLLNPTREINSFKELEKEKKTNEKLFVIAPHPFYPGKTCLKNELINNIDLFDAIEISFFNHFFVNYFNKKAIKIAKKHDKPLITTSDSHNLKNFGYNYVVSNEKNLLDTIKNNKHKNKTEKMKTKDFLKIINSVIFN